MDRSHLARMLAVCVALGLAGKAAADEHNHANHNHAGHSHKHLTEKDVKLPKDYAAAIARIKKCRATIAEEIAAGHFDAVHAPLDEATIILGKLMTLARDSGIPKSQWQEINLASKDLKQRLGELHSALESKRKIDFKTAAVPIDQAIRRLDLTARAPSEVLTR